MKRILILCLMVGLVGCQKIETKTKDAAKESLKDPESTKFRNVKKYCGEVNAKNSYGGYTGFKRFYVSDGVPSFQNNDEDSMKFELGWLAHCERESQLPQTKIDECVSFGNFAAAVIRSKQAGVPQTTTGNSITTDSIESKKMYDKVINEGYKNYDDQNEYAVKILLDCMSGKIKAPAD